MTELKALIKAVPDFPKEGILFRDITPLLASPSGFKLCMERMREIAGPLSPTAIVGAESRGFLFGVPLAMALDIPFIPARKPGKLPRPTLSASYSLEYGQDTLEIHQGDLSESDRVLFIDDLLATGGTASACLSLIKSAGAEVIGSLFLIELVGLGGRDRLMATPCHALIQYDEP